jgi:DHA1 family multidrug resistance protein-like MFS transporter
LKETLLDKKFLILFGISYIVPLYIIYLNLYMKLIFMPIINDDHFLASCAIVVTLSAIIGAPFWGYMGDSIGFKKTLLIILISDILCKIFGIFCSEKWNIIMLYSMLSFNDKGILTIIGPGLIEMFGLEMATELIPYKGLSIFLAFITVPAFQLIFSSFLHFRLILVVFLLFTGVALVMTLYFYFKIEYVKRVEPEEGDEKHRF